MRRGQPPVVLILGTMGTRLTGTDGQAGTAWIPVRPWSVFQSLDRLRCNERGEPVCSLETAGSLDRWPWDFVSPLRNELARHELALDMFPYDWRQSHFRSAEDLSRWLDARGYESCDLIGVSTGGLIATQYMRMGHGDRVRKFVSLGTPFLGMPRAIASLHTGVGLGPFADLFLARKVSDLVRTFPSTYELIPSQSCFEAEPFACLEVDGTPLTSHAAMLDWLQTVPRANSRLLNEGQAFLSQLNPIETLRNVEASFIVNSRRSTPARITYTSKETVQVTSRNFGDGSVPVTSQTMGQQTEAIHPGRTFPFRGRHRTMHLNRDVMRKIVEILLSPPNSSGSPGPNGCEVTRQESV